MAETPLRRYSLFPRSLANSVEQIMKPVCKKHGFAEHRILTRWEEIVGAQWSACSVPQKLSYKGRNKDQGTLHIMVASGRALELQHMQPLILERIASYFGHKAVERLVFVQTSQPFLRRKPVKPMPAPAPDARFMSIAQTCEDAELRAALLLLAGTLTVEK